MKAWIAVALTAVDLLLALPLCLAAEPASSSAPASTTRPQGEIVGIEALQGRKDALALLKRNQFVVTGEQGGNIEQFYGPAVLVIDPNQLEQELGQAFGDLEKVSPAQVLREVTKHMLLPLITTDALLHAYGVVYSDSLKQLEMEMASRMREWQGRLWDRLQSADASVLSEEESVRLDGLVAVGCRLLDPNWSPTEKELPKWVDAEVKRVLASAGSANSDAWNQVLEYSLFRPRGFYAGNEVLERYFRARAWWSACGFDGNDDVQRRMALQLGIACARTDRTWGIVHAYDGLLGSAEDPSVLDMWSGALKAIEPKAWDLLEMFGKDQETRDQMLTGFGGGESWSPDNLRAKLPEIVKSLARDFPTAIRTVTVKDQGPAEDKGCRIYVMPRSYVTDSEVFTLTTASPVLAGRPPRGLPTGLDIMSALGGELALKLLMEGTPKEFQGSLKAALRKARESISKGNKLSQVTEATYRVLESLLNPKTSPAHPPFMKSAAYLGKSLQTALAGWAEHRYRWVLHAKQSAGIFGGPPPLEPPPGFVEPNPEFWQRLLDLTVLTQKALADAGAPDNRGWADLAAATLQCRTIAEAQLEGKELSQAQREFFATFHTTLARLCTPKEGHESGVGLQAVVADVHREYLLRSVLHVGTGLPQVLYAVYPYKGKNWLCRGGVMTYREYVAGDGRTLTVQEWQRMLDKLPPPEWTKDFAQPPEIRKAGDSAQ